jgi:hypothetical protein
MRSLIQALGIRISTRVRTRICFYKPFPKKQRTWIRLQKRHNRCLSQNNTYINNCRGSFLVGKIAAYSEHSEGRQLSTVKRPVRTLWGWPGQSVLSSPKCSQSPGARGRTDRLLSRCSTSTTVGSSPFLQNPRTERNEILTISSYNKELHCCNNKIF